MYLLKTQNDPNPTKYLKTSKQISTFHPHKKKNCKCHRTPSGKNKQILDISILFIIIPCQGKPACLSNHHGQ